MNPIREVLIPSSQRLSVAELRDLVDFSHGDTSAKRSGFVIMLVLSSVIATAGVVTDSTATVIGAMIIAPLATPIHGIAFGIVGSNSGLLFRSMAWVVGGGLGTVVIGYLLSFAVGDPTALATNSQVVGRVSPGMADLLAAIATGLVGAWALCRRDLGAVLPGVAVAISLVPPLAVVGVCLGQGLQSYAVGALVLFSSNVLAMIGAGSILYSLAGYQREWGGTGRHRFRAYVILAPLALLVCVPLAFNTYFTWLLDRSSAAAAGWGRDEGAEIGEVAWRGQVLEIEVVTPDGEPPSITALQEELRSAGVPDFIEVEVVVTPRRTVEVQ